MKTIYTTILLTLLLTTSALYSQCEYTAVLYDWTGCSNGTMQELHLLIEGGGLGNQGFNITYENNTYFIPSNTGTININVSTPSFTIEICSVQNPTCCTSRTFDNPCRTDCEIYNVNTEINCGENGGYLNNITFNPEGNDLGNEGFMVTIDGITYASSNPYSLTINNLFIPAQTFTYTLCSQASPTCCYTFTMENPCFTPCDLSSVDITQTCSNNTLTNLIFEPSGINLGIDGFSIELDGVTYSTSGTSLNINNLQLTDPVIEYTICCNEYPGFCHTFEFENECFGYVPICNISSVTTFTICTSPAHYKLTMTPHGTNLGNQGYHGYVNGVSFNKNLPTIVLDSLVTDSLIVYTICSNASANCCFSDTISNPCFVNQSPCSIIGATSSVSCDSTNTYSIAITPSVFSQDTLGYFGSVNNTTFNQDSSTILLHHLTPDSLIIYHICSISNPTCCFSDTIINPCFVSLPTCSITNVVSSVHCTSSTTYSLTLTPQGHNLGNLGFHGLVNNTAFNQDSNTVILDSLTSDSLIVYTICSNTNPNCCKSDTITNPCYALSHQCHINSVKTDLVCQGEYIENIVFTIHAENAGTYGFTLYFNGVTYTSPDSLIEVDSLHITASQFTFTICSSGDSTCCYTDTRLNPCDLNCVINHVITNFNCDTLTLIPLGSHLGSLGFSGMVNGVPFNQPHSAIMINNISTNDSLIVYHICSNAFPTCCYSDTLVNACYSSHKPCNLIVTKTNLINSSSGLSLEIAVSLLGTCPNKLSVWKDDIYLGKFDLVKGYITIPSFTFNSNQAVIKICPSGDETECVEFTIINTATDDIENGLKGITIMPLEYRKYAIGNLTEQDLSLTVLSLQGVDLQHVMIQKYTNEYILHLNNLPPGLYILHAQIGKAIKTYKIALTD